jgi:hypothetical protein
MNVWVNGALALSNLTPSIRASTNVGAPVSYVEFTVNGPADFTSILFSADPSTGNRRNVVINGFEIDTPNAARVPQSPVPMNGDEHVNADTGNVALQWTAPLIGMASAYHLYAGTSAPGVKDAADSSSPYFVNATSLTSLLIPVTNSHLTYYWRVDVVDGLGNVTKGVVWNFRPRMLAFPGAEGYGRYARGGRGGAVVKVTSLADYESGQTPIPGTLRYAVEEATGPRTIVFDVSGLITLTRRITINTSQPYITIAGQTAPGKGICIRNFPLGLSGGRDCVVRFIRNRVGNLANQTLDGGGLGGCDHCIMDHCSISWGQDEEFSSRNGLNISLQRTLISEALNIAGHQNYSPGTRHGYAASIGGDTGSFHHNLLAHCEGRNWSLAGGLDGAGYYKGKLDIRNNVVYNWRSRTTDGGAHKVNFVNNYYKAGAATSHYKLITAEYEGFPGTQQYFMEGNVLHRLVSGVPTEITDQNTLRAISGTPNAGTGGNNAPAYVSTPFFEHYVTTHSAADAFRHVLCDTGCNQPVLDDHDSRVIQETRTGTYTYTGTGPYGGSPGLPNSQEDVGGWENYGNATRSTDFDADQDGISKEWEQAHGQDPTTANSNADPDNDGYTQLEDYLNFLAGPHTSTPKNVTTSIDLGQYGRGFSAAATYSVAGAVGGVVSLLSNQTAQFIPQPDFTGVGRFTFTVSEAGQSVTQTMQVLVTTPSSLPSPPTPEIASVQRSGANIQISCTSATGYHYRLLGSPSPLGPWQILDTKSGTGAPLSFTSPLSEPRHFFRIESSWP